jgi:alpha-1,2-mannosyltransferase
MRATWNEEWLTGARLWAYPRIALVLYVMLAAGWFVLSKNLLDASGKPLGYDFIAFWTASDLALQGRAIEAYDPQKIFAAAEAVVPGIKYLFAWHYPPVFHLVVLPLALLPYLWSYALWMAATLALYLGVLRRIAPGPYTIWLLLAFPAAFLNLMHGQNGFVSAALLAAACLNLEKRPALAGLFIGLLCYKPQLGLLIPLVLTAGRHWTAFFSAAATTLAFCGIATLVFGTENWIAFWENLPTQQQNLEAGLLHLHKMPTVFAATRLLGGGLSLAYALHIAVGLGVAALTIYVWYRRAGTLELRAALLAVALVIISPYSYDYDMVILALPIALLAADGIKNGWAPGMRTMLVAVWAASLILPMIAEHATVQLMPALLLAFFAMIYSRAVNRPDRRR